MNKITTVICVFLLVGLTTAGTTAQRAVGKEDQKVKLLVMYGRVAVTEFCQKSKIWECREIAKWIDDSGYELFNHGRGRSRQHLLIFDRAGDEYFSYAMLAFDKDGWIEVVQRGVHTGERKEFIKGFEEEGDFAR